jgi:hypothetical protein
MGANPYQYVVPWQPDLGQALQELRRDVFLRGDYHGAEEGHATPDEALMASAEEGTHSILDIAKISRAPAMCTACVFDEEELQRYFGTTRPTLEAIEGCDELWNDIDRGSARIVIAYENARPSQLVFMGYSFD